MATLLAAVLLSMTTVASSQSGEFLACRQWADRFLGVSPSASNTPCLKLLFEDVAEGITRGQSWRGTPYQLGTKIYSHGIAFNSTKHILVRLGQPAARFVAEVGLENNDDTRRGAALGNGSVTFHVLARGRELFASPVLRLEDGAVRLDAPLGGAAEFEIRVGDGGDGRGWDQALWAEAAVVLEDGCKLRLQDLPWAESLGHNPYGFAFLYGGEPSAALAGRWERQAREQALDSQRLLREACYRDPATGLEVRVEAVQFGDFPAIEWVVYLKNNATTNTPLIESIQVLDGILPVPGAGPFRLHWAKGAVASFDDFAPQESLLKAGATLHWQPGGGRSSSQVLPFFNVEGAGGGVIAALGWSGEWAADFACDTRGQPSLKAGMALTRLFLRPGESIRTPRILLLRYEGDRWRGQNLLRQFLLAHHRPRRAGEPLVGPITCGNWGGTAAEVHLDNIRKIIEHDLPLDYYWIDAEWFGKGGWPVNVGDWEVKKSLYPAGFRPLSEALRGSGRELMLWFEPERVYKNTPWHQAHREWLLDAGGDSCLLDLGNIEARRFLTEFISSKVDEFGLGCYRQDFNIDPLGFWRRHDAPDRQGMTEIRYIEGLYAFWDELLARHPGLIIDNCASGGRRIDLETVGRATPFWRTDGPRDAIAHQCHTYGLLAWVPLSATSQDRAGDSYEFRSSMCSSLCLNWWVSGDAPAERIPDRFPFAWAKQTLEQYLKIRSFYYGDYYPLTAYSQARDLWQAYQLDRPDLAQGLVVALRRPDSPYESARLALRGLEADAAYQVSNLDTGERITASGKALGTEGLSVVLKARPGSALIAYERMK
ncbi:MAG TPA: alpha-galactosidase [Candidatus Paceibacterota bacterium]|nr:alpha-galactosidase [Verrucomicrobiota bacterium]HOX02093.1 alpha-galactosidase [Verrucomicrobiota bacterium]HRZ44965.1 alpha-galactosidase [Candidatus Paceibacterota bacterium]